MTNPRFLITGATGATGSEAIAALRANGQEVRALAHREDDRSEALRRQGVEVVVGDLKDYDAVKAALRGVNRAYFCYPIGPGLVQATAQFAQAAKAAGVEAIVNMSQKIAREDALSHASFQHWLAERVFDGAGVPVTHIRPTFFAEWLLYLAPMIRQGKIYAPYGDGKTALITAEDQGRVIASILENPASHKGRTYVLDGPVEYTWPEIAAVVGRVLGRKVEYQQVPFEMMRAAFSTGRENVGRNDALTGYAESNQAAGAGESHINQHLRNAVNDHHNGLFSGVSDAVERITGKPPLTIEAFILKHKKAFA